MPRPRLFAALPLAVALALGTAACGAGFDAGTGQVQRGTNGSAGQVGDIAVRNLLLLQDSADPPVTTLVAGLVNNGGTADQLTSVQVADAGAVPLSPITVPGGGLVTPSVGDGPVIQVPNATFRPGGYAKVTLTFKNAGQLSLDVFVMAPSGPSNGG
jgi:hypothetical protein